MSVSRDTSSASTPLANGEVFIAGGYGSETTADLFNPSTNSFSSVGPLQTARLYASAALLQSGKVLLAGGVGSSGRITDVELYDPVAGTFTTVASLPNPYSQGSLTVLNDGRVLAAGGISNSGIANTAALYDPVANTWSGTGLMNHPRALHTAQLLADGTVFVAGGVDEENTLATAEIYNPATNQFTALSSQMSYPRRNFSSLTLPSGKILLPAGFDENDFGPSQLLTACDLFDPVSKTFSPTGAALVQRINYGLALLPNGHVLMAGGEGGSAAMATAEIYW
jgi:N-acetylneuraminic acid mutarotase